MFSLRYFAKRFFPQRYFPGRSQVVPPTDPGFQPCAFQHLAFQTTECDQPYIPPTSGTGGQYVLGGKKPKTDDDEWMIFFS